MLLIGTGNREPGTRDEKNNFPVYIRPADKRRGSGLALLHAGTIRGIDDRLVNLRRVLADLFNFCVAAHIVLGGKKNRKARRKVQQPQRTENFNRRKCSRLAL